MSKGYKNFLLNNIAIGSDREYMRNSGIENTTDIEFGVPTDPQKFLLTENQQSEPTVTSYLQRSSGDLLITDQKVLYVRNLAGIIAVNTELNSGLTAVGLTDESSYLGSLFNKVKLFNYFQEAGGYVATLANKELHIPSNIKSIVSLVGQHRVFLFITETEPNTVYTLTLNDNRKLKGFTKLNVPIDVHNIVKINESKVCLVSKTGLYYLDFNTLYTSFKDQIDKDTSKTYECAVSTMPVLKLREDSFSATRSLKIQNLVIGMTGNPAFNIEILGDNNRGYEANTNNKISFRKTSISDLTEDITFSGQLLVNNIPINGSSQPVVRLSKDDDNYIEIASMNMEIA